MILVDADVMIDVIRRHPPALSWFASFEEAPPTLVGFSAMELVQGCCDGEDLRKLDRLLARMSVLWPSDTVCATGYWIFHRFHLSHGIGLIDSLIAATAVQYEVPLMSFNRKHFGAVPRLILMEPYER